MNGPEWPTNGGDNPTEFRLLLSALPVMAVLLLLTSCGSTDGRAALDTTADNETSAVIDDESSEREARAPTEAETEESMAEVQPSGGQTKADLNANAGPGSDEADDLNEEGRYGPIASAPSIDQLVNEGRPLNLAHAGGDQSWPHSTMYAFSESAKAGVDLLELDVRLTGDGELIVHHDETVDRTTELKAQVSDLTLAELQALDNAYWFRPGCWACADNESTDYLLRGVRTRDLVPPEGYGPDDFRIETFRSIATAFPTHALDIEIKGDLPGAAATAQVLAQEIRELGRTESVVVVSFDDEVVDTFGELAPEVEVSPGLDRLTEWFLSGEPLEDRFRIIQVPPVSSGIEVITEATVGRAHAEGLVVWAWADDASTQENAEFYQKMLDLGVDGFITGRPELFPKR